MTWQSSCPSSTVECTGSSVFLCQYVLCTLIHALATRGIDERTDPLGATAQVVCYHFCPRRGSRAGSAARWWALTFGLTVIISNATMVNIRMNRRRPLTPLEQFVIDYVWAHPGCTAEMCRQGLAPRRALKDSTIRTVLRNLEEKGYVSHDVHGRTFVYRAVETPRNVAVEGAQRLIDQFCGGSVEEFLVGLVDNQVLEPRELRRLAEKIALRKGKKP
jgi:BlaI family transcriptional regulator, penicillinase repressor